LHLKILNNNPQVQCGSPVQRQRGFWFEASPGKKFARLHFNIKVGSKHLSFQLCRKPKDESDKEKLSEK
jgi:hypothetical protein